jgi:hypothetical protein
MSFTVHKKSGSPNSFEVIYDFSVRLSKENLTPNVRGPISNNSFEIDKKGISYNDFIEQKQDKAVIDLVNKLIDKKIDKLHKLGYIHGDLHGGNILIYLNENNFDIFFIDFEYTFNIHKITTGRLELLNIFLELDMNVPDESNRMTLLEKIIKREKDMYHF